MGVFGHFRLAEGRQPIFTVPMMARSRSWSSSLSWSWLVATLLAFTFITTADTLHDAPELSGSIKSITRTPRLFFVSSTTSTSFASTRCYLTTSTTACKRKRRELISDELESENSFTNIAVIPAYEKGTEGQSEER